MASTAATTGKPEGARWAGWAAIVFAVLFVAGFLLLNTPDTDASVDEWQQYFEDSGDRTVAVLHGYAWALAAIAFLVFLSGIRAIMRAAAEWVGSVAFVTGISFAVLLFVSAAATSAVAGGIEFGDVAEEGAGEYGLWFEQLGFGALLLCGMLAAGVFVAAASFALLRSGSLPGWLAVSGYVVGAVLFVLGVLFFPVILLALWTLIAGIVLVVGSGAASGVTQG